ncbi:MAG: PPOX class F420-dependent oxidoreductase [Deltaproteobacteria bacterium RBG_13_65_10]|jgi:PPOX class probable F420-dependent enzyme|nr:MAG: PPOX class F420-dependent oxidoreductase [Deltaproteobacteria bacterium RBG_13_65_10]
MTGAKEEALRFLTQARVARLATADRGAMPHVVPVVFAVAGHRVFIPIDHKPKRDPDPNALRRVRNLRENPRAALLADRYDEDWKQLAWVRVDGPVALVQQGPLYREGVSLLTQKYPQYHETPLRDEGSGLLIVLHIDTLRSWRAA